MRRVHITLLFGLALFGIGVVYALALNTTAGRALEPRAHAATAIENSATTFSWNMPKRFGAKRPDGIADYHWDGTAYEKEYINPKAWKVDFDACALGNLPASTFAWEVDGLALQNPNPTSCNFSHEFPTQGTYIVRLTRTSSDGTQTLFEAPVTVKDLLIVSLGDSFASGQGNPEIPRDGATPAKWVDLPCARSSKAGPAKAALKIENDDPHTSVTFLSFACTGAEVLRGILAPQTTARSKLPAQIDRLKDALNGRQIDALIISGGGNHIGFADLVARCISPIKCHQDSKTLNKFASGLDILDALYDALSCKIEALPSVKKVFITEYPDVVHDEQGNLCDSKAGLEPVYFITHDEAKWASEQVISGLNRKVRKAAERHGWVYVAGISDKFLRHGYCASDGWVRTFLDARRTQGADGVCNLSAFKSVDSIKACLISSGTFHPTENGHEAYASSLIEALRRDGLVAAPGP